MEIKLKNNWSEQYIYGDKTPGYFVGRNKEIKTLKNTLVNNDSSSILVSSVRGVGKTSFVHKTLQECGTKITPIFVNIGHALENADIDKTNKTNTKKLILVSLIRASHFHFKAKNNKDDELLSELYRRCFSKYKKETLKEDAVETKKSAGLSAEVKPNTKTILVLVSMLLYAGSLAIDILPIRYVIGLIATGSLVLTLTWRKEWTDKLSNSSSEVIDNSTEYLEIEFERWLLQMKEGGQKVVFIIDELDKIEEKDSLSMIKAYKNLFSRPFAHFIFIASQKAYELVNTDREASHEDGGTFPTLFTEVIYLPLPTSEELREYLFEITENIKKDNKDVEALFNYLLFESENDFFLLKRLISDLSEFKDDDILVLNTDNLGKNIKTLNRKAKLYNYVDKWFLGKELSPLKINWKSNSELQRRVFVFLKRHFGSNFSDPELAGLNLERLKTFLIKIGVLSSKEVVKNPSQPSIKTTEYIWTNRYTRDVTSPLTDEDKAFQGSFKSLTKVANDIDDLVEHYQDKKFEDYDTISDGHDGSNHSGINLYSIYEEYEVLHDNLEDPEDRLSISRQEVVEAKKTVDEQVSNVMDRYYEVAVSAISEVLKGEEDMFVAEPLDSPRHNINTIYQSFPGLSGVLTPSAYDVKVFGRNDQTKYVFLIRYFEDEGHIHDALKTIEDNKNVLFVSLTNDRESAGVRYFAYEQGSGKKKKKVKVENFAEYTIKDMRQLSDVITLIKNHLVN